MTTRRPTVELREQLAHGLCVGVRLDGGAHRDPQMAAQLHPDEAGRLAELPTPVGRTWMAGRLAMREALGEVDAPVDAAVGRSERGAPVLPSGFLGSLSHKRVGEETVAVALVGPAHAEGGDWLSPSVSPLPTAPHTLGVDLEVIDHPREAIRDLILLPEERRAVDALPPDARWAAVLLRFSLKEAIYKAIDPWLGRWVDYHEVLVVPHPTGRAEVFWNGPLPAPLAEIRARWMRRGQLILTTARAISRENP